MPQHAWGPDPADGAELVPTDTTLTWNFGDLDTEGFAVEYDVYIGTDETAVADADTDSPEYMTTVEPTSYDAVGLESETEHFWRIDTVRTLTKPPFDITVTPGEVWSFTTLRAGFGGSWPGRRVRSS